MGLKKIVTIKPLGVGGEKKGAPEGIAPFFIYNAG